jgi:hypothetical protein
MLVHAMIFEFNKPLITEDILRKTYYLQYVRLYRVRREVAVFHKDLVCQGVKLGQVSIGNVPGDLLGVVIYI